MVVFTCSYCGESLKKNKVEKHYTIQKCRRNTPALTCVDCLKDFYGQDYVAHTSCVTEEERYSAKGFQSKPPSEKGKRKQEQWIKSINEVLNEDMKIEPNVRKLLQKIVEEPNVPQKKPKFINFCSNKYKFLNHDCFEAAWVVLENLKLKLKGDNGKVSKEESKDDSIDRKRKRVDSGNLSPNDESFDNSSALKPENGDLNPSKSQKKPKRYESQSEIVEEVSEEAVGEKRDKKSKKKNGYAGDNDYVDDFEANGTESNSVDSRNNEDNKDTPNDEQTENSEVKLSKKEKKQKRKKEKYEKQLLEINEAVPEKVSEGTDDSTHVNMKKTRKKDLQVADKYCAIESELNGETGNGKKKKKRQEPLPEINQVEELENGVDIYCTKSNKFNWEEIIIKVLEAKGELPLKRLEKKVVSEYMNTCATVKSVDEALAKFHKKVMKIPRVKVRKEVAKLVS